MYWGRPEAVTKLDYLFGDSMPLEGAYTDRCLAGGYAVDITTPLFIEAGISVVKVIYPKLQPMFFAESERKILGVPDCDAMTNEPHPYA